MAEAIPIIYELTRCSFLTSYTNWIKKMSHVDNFSDWTGNTQTTIKCTLTAFYIKCI